MAAKRPKPNVNDDDDSKKICECRGPIVHLCAVATRVYGFVGGRVPCNARLTTMIETIKPILRDAIEHMNQVKVWILLLIPRMEDGNNFGVSIQEEVGFSQSLI